MARRKTTTNILSETRRNSLENLRVTLRAAFEALPEHRSIMIAFSQFWNDGADDELHAKYVASRRDLPVWPHACHDEEEPEYDEDGNELPVHTRHDDSERCSWCSAEVGYANIGSTAETRAFETYCHEEANQEQSVGQNYLPYAVARRRGDDIEYEVIGVPQRPYQELVPASSERVTWLDDPQARALYDLVCAAPREDAPRRVLGDYLQEREHPHGELIALSLATDLDEAGRARRAVLQDQLARPWLGPLGNVVPYDSAYFDRGFISRVLVTASAEDEAKARGHAAWGTIERIDLAADSEPILDPSMVALREVGMLSPLDLERLLRASRPWAIESLRIRVDDRHTLDQLATTNLLPRLVELVVGGSLRHAAAAELDVKKLVVIDHDWLPDASMFHGTNTIGVCGERNGDRASWELAFTGGDHVVAKLVGWSTRSPLTELAIRIAALPAQMQVTIERSPFFTAVAEDAERVRDTAARQVRVA